MKKKFVRFLTVLLLMVLGLSMGACSKVENTSSSNGKDAAAKETEEIKDLPKADYKVLKEGVSLGWMPCFVRLVSWCRNMCCGTRAVMAFSVQPTEH